MSTFERIVTGRHRFSLVILLTAMVVFPCAVFTEIIWLDYLAWVFLMILGFFVFATGVITSKEARESKSWPISYAQLDSVKILRRHANKGAWVYYISISCHFEVNGQIYRGTNYDWSGSAGAKSLAEKQKKEIEAMASVKIYYNPEDPSISVVHPGIRPVHYLRYVLGLAMFFVPIYMVAQPYL